MSISGTRETKRLMADAFRSLILKKPFSKITIGEIARESAMTRENFYYHFRDKYDIVHWICKQELWLQLPKTGCSFVEWVEMSVHLVLREESYYRRLVKGIGIEQARVYILPYVEKPIGDMVRNHFHRNPVWNSSKDKEDFVISYFSDSFVCFFLNYLLEHENIDEQDFHQKFLFLVDNCLRCAKT